MGELLQFTIGKYNRRIDVRDVLANFANNAEGDLSEKLARLVELMDERNHEIVKLEQRQCEIQK